MAEDGGTPALEKLWATVKTWWATALLHLHIVIGLSFAVVILAAIAISILGYVFHWDWTGVTEKRFWHWLELLIVPVLLSGGGFLLYSAWAWSDHRVAEKQHHEAARDANLDLIVQKYLELPPIGEKWIHLQGGHGMLDHLGSC